MISRDRANIAQIKDLNVIFFYSLDNDYYGFKNGNLLGLKIVYSDNKALDYDYTSPYFKEFVEKVIDVYKKEKNYRKFTFLNKLTKELLENNYLEHEVIVDESEDCFYQDKPILEFNSRKRGLDIAKSYLYDVVKSILPIFYNSQEVLVELLEIKGFREKMTCSLKVLADDGEDEVVIIPIILVEEKDRQYNFQISGLNNTCVELKGNILFDANGVVINCFSDNDEIVYNDAYSKSGLREKKLYLRGELVDFDSSWNNASEDELKVINFYLNCFDSQKIDESIKCGDNCYLLRRKIEEENDKNIFHDETFHVYLDDRAVVVDYYDNYGLKKYDGNFVLPIYSRKIEYSFLPLDTRKFSDIIMQKYIKVSNQMKGDYSAIVNRYSYKVFASLDEKFDSMKEVSWGNFNENIFTKQVDNGLDIKKLIKKEGLN